jgi:hypothetical protein
MTRLLSDLLNAEQPGFSQRIRQLERASGEPGADIRLSSEIIQRTHNKIRDLGLDPLDTTGQELYLALQQRLLMDEKRLLDYLGLDTEGTAKSTEVLSGVLQFLSKLDLPRTCFALKASTSKRLLKQVVPKKAMAELKYRSIDSMIKHEAVAQIRVASLLYERNHWQKDFFDQYNKLTPSDFETRQIAVLFPRSSRYEKIAETFAVQHRHHSVVFKELGSVVVLPVQASVPALAITSLLMLLDGFNSIRCASTYLKLQQVTANFGGLVHETAFTEPKTVADFAGQPLPWRSVQYYYHSVKEAYHPAFFEPHVQPEDLTLIQAESTLAQAVPALTFWEDTAGLAHVDQGQTVSLNMLDVALSAANGLAFENRPIKHVREQVWSDIISRYLRHRDLNDNLAEQLSVQPAGSRLETGVTI